MRLGLIADIHADLPNLQKALALLDAQNIDAILCAGDLVERGYQGDAVVNLLRERRIPCVQGNHDHDAVDNQRWWREQMTPEAVAESLHKSAHPEQFPGFQTRLLHDTTLAYLHDLPFELRFLFEGVRVLLVHGSPESNMEYLSPRTFARRYKALAQKAVADVVICGHTHQPMHITAAGVHFVNPGSVYRGDALFRLNSHTCAVLELPECKLTVFKLATGEGIPLRRQHKD